MIECNSLLLSNHFFFLQKLLESKKRLPSRPATPGGQLHAGPSTKGTQSENYIANLLRKIDLRMGQDPGIAASAA